MYPRWWVLCHIGENVVGTCIFCSFLSLLVSHLKESVSCKWSSMSWSTICFLFLYGCSDDFKVRAQVEVIDRETRWWWLYLIQTSSSPVWYNQHNNNLALYGFTRNRQHSLNWFSCPSCRSLGIVVDNPHHGEQCKSLHSSNFTPYDQVCLVYNMIHCTKNTVAEVAIMIKS